MENQHRPETIITPGSTPPPPPDSKPEEPYNPDDTPSTTPVISPKPKHRKKWLRIWLFVLVLALAGGAAAYYLMSRQKDTPKPAATATANTAAASPKFCFVRLGYLVCTDAQGENRSRYNLPVSSSKLGIVSLDASQNQSAFVALTASTETTKAEVMLLDSKLKLTKQLNLPKGGSPLAPTLSRDGKSVLLDLSDSGSSRQIFRYDLAGGTSSKLTTNGINSYPAETKSGSILYSYAASTPGKTQLQLMDGNGSSTKPLPGMVSLKSVSSFSYDEPTDTVYVVGVDANNKGVVLYATVNDLLVGKTPASVAIEEVTPSSSIARITGGNFALSKGFTANLIETSTGRITGNITKYGKPVGWLKVNGFTPSKQQTEQATDRIEGLSAAPADFQALMQTELAAGDAKCGGSPDGGEFRITLNKIVRDEFADTNQSCLNSSRHYYAKVNGAWAKAFSAQMTPACDQVNQFKFPGSVIPTCISGNKETPNTNP